MVIVKASKLRSGRPAERETPRRHGQIQRGADQSRRDARRRGLHPSSKGTRVSFSGGKRTVIDGPFAETKELVAGFWLWRCQSLEEAIGWAKRCPNPMPGEEAEIEIRQVFEAEDFGPALTPELRAQEERLRAELAEGRTPDNQRKSICKRSPHSYGSITRPRRP